MKKIFLSVVIVILMSSVCLADPFLVCDPPLAGEPIPVTYKLTGGAWVPTSVPAMADGTIRLDLVNAPTGTNSMTVAACGVPDDVWEVCSDAVPFTFIRPRVQVSPKALKLSR